MKQKILLTATLASLAATMFVFSPSAEAASQCGKASWYSLPGNKTANGEIMNPSAMTAAHRALPFGTEVKVTNRNNGKSVVVRINDRGPFVGNRVIDLSKGAAARIGMIRSGVASVQVTSVDGTPIRGGRC